MVGAIVLKTWVAPSGFLIRKIYPKGNFSTLPNVEVKVFNEEIILLVSKPNSCPA